MAGDINGAWRGHSAVHAADALLHALGGLTVQVRVAASAAVNSDAAQLGLEGATAEDIPLAPVVVRNAPGIHDDCRLRSELLVSANTLAHQRDLRDVTAAREFFLRAMGIVLGGELLRVVSFSADEFAGVPYLYRLIVSE